MDNLIGFSKGWRILRDRYAPKVLLGYEFDDWGSANINISHGAPPPATVRNSARLAGSFFNEVAAGEVDFAALTVGEGAEEGQSPDPNFVYTEAEKAALVEFIREFVRVARVPMVLEGVPLGNTVRKAITDKPFHWRDSWVQWLIGDDVHGPGEDARGRRDRRHVRRQRR